MHVRMEKEGERYDEFFIYSRAHRGHRSNIHSGAPRTSSMFLFALVQPRAKINLRRILFDASKKSAASAR